MNKLNKSLSQKTKELSTMTEEENKKKVEMDKLNKSLSQKTKELFALTEKISKAEVSLKAILLEEAKKK